MTLYAGNRSPFSRGGRGVNTKSYGDLMFPDSDISFVSSGRPSTDRMSPSIYDYLDSTKTPRMTHEDHYYMDRSFESAPTPRRSFGQDSHESSGPLWSPQVMVSTSDPAQVLPELPILIPDWMCVYGGWSGITKS